MIVKAPRVATRWASIAPAEPTAAEQRQRERRWLTALDAVVCPPHDECRQAPPDRGQPLVGVVQVAPATPEVDEAGPADGAEVPRLGVVLGDGDGDVEVEDDVPPAARHDDSLPGPLDALHRPAAGRPAARRPVRTGGQHQRQCGREPACSASVGPSCENIILRVSLSSFSKWNSLFWKSFALWSSVSREGCSSTLL